jgi:hypothetical protein
MYHAGVELAVVHRYDIVEEKIVSEMARKKTYYREAW